MISPPARRLVAYAAFTLAVLGLAELTIRRNEKLFRAISHRVLTKAELLDRKPTTEIIFFGTSRTWDGVSARLFAEELEAATGRPKPTTFNLATTGSSLETLEYLTTRFAARPGLKLALVELTVPQLEQEPLPWADPPLNPQATLEDTLQSDIRRHIKLIELRTLFVGENFVRIIPLVAFPDRLDGSEVNPKDFLRAARGEKFESRVSEAEYVTWKPQKIASREGTKPSADPVLDRLATILEAFDHHGVRVILFVPPLRRDDAREERSDKLQHLYADLVARTDAQIWDFVSAADQNESDSFRDTSHLNRRGRARFSQALARTLSTEAR